MMKMPKSSPVSAFHNLRRFIFATYEKQGLDVALGFIQNSRALPQVKAGLRGEFLFYDKYMKKLKLEPLLDAGVKADFTGIRKGKPVNFDVTTNLEYKNIDSYLEPIQKRKKQYEIVLVDIKNEEMESFPLKFPIWSKCGKFSHYILYLEPPTTALHHTLDISGEQTIVQLCNKCKRYDEKMTTHFEIGLLGPQIEEMSVEKDVDESLMYSAKETEEYQNRESISIVKFVEKQSGLLLSGLAENDYIVTDPRDGSGYYDGLLRWKHPLARDMNEHLGLYYGKWEPDKSDINLP